MRTTAVTDSLTAIGKYSAIGCVTAADSDGVDTACNNYIMITAGGDSMGTASISGDDGTVGGDASMDIIFACVTAFGGNRD